MTEQTEIPNSESRNGWVLYDGDCPMCIRLAVRFASILRRHDFDLAPLQSLWVRSRLGSGASEPLDEMFVLTPSWEVYGGADAVVFLARRIWWAWPLYAITKLPGVMWLLRHLYRCVARNRTCFGGRCVRTQERKESNS